MMPYSLKSLYLRALHTSEDVYCVDVWQEDDEIYIKHNKRDGSFYTKGWRDRYK
jgi:hypothetical protein